MSFKKFLTEANHLPVSKSVLVYMPAALATDDEGFKCTGCHYFDPSKSKCNLMVKKDNDVSADGVCNGYMPGPNNGAKLNLFTKKQAAYVDHPTHCASCKFRNKEVNRCSRIEGPIEPNACCNAWEE